MTINIRHTKKQVNGYHQQIKKLVLEPLQKDIIARFAKVPPLSTSWKNAINLSFNDKNYTDSIDEGSVNISTDYIDDLSEWQQKKMVTQFSQLFNIDVVPLLKESKTQQTLQPIIATNIDLIKSISAELLQQVNDDFNNIIFNYGFDQQKILNMLTDRFDVSNSRAKLIANDQTGKTIGALTQTRHLQAGVREFEWHTSEDSRVRPTHQELDGKIFSWVNPATGIGIPGQEINCRCIGRPVITSLQ